ncbi:MAG: hypothetical protein AAF725_20920, partial [Acidobacteriota bacterium]
RAAADCGPESEVASSIRSTLTLEFVDRSDLPDVLVPLEAELDNTVGLLEALPLVVRAGQRLRVEVGLGGAGEEAYRVKVAGEWPSDLEIGLVTSTFGRPPEEEAAATSSGVYRGAESEGEGRQVFLQVEAARCCPTGNFFARLEAEPSSGGGQRFRKPLEIEVTGDAWTCWLPRILSALIGLLVFLLTLYVFNIFANSRFIAAEELSSQLALLKWDDYGGTQRDSRRQDSIRQMVRKKLSFRARASAWWRAKPWRFGLPNGSYEESVELSLYAKGDVNLTILSPVGEPDLHRSLQEDPERGRGRLYASSVGGTLTFFGVPGPRGRLSGALVAEGDQHLLWDGDGEDAAPPPRLVEVRRKLRLIDPLAEKQEGKVAGWEVG